MNDTTGGPLGMSDFLTPGMLVRNPAEPDWGVGQVQSNIGGRITVTFPEAGKRVIDARVVGLVPVME